MYAAWFMWFKIIYGILTVAKENVWRFTSLILAIFFRVFLLAPQECFSRGWKQRKLIYHYRISELWVKERWQIPKTHQAFLLMQYGRKFSRYVLLFFTRDKHYVTLPVGRISFTLKKSNNYESRVYHIFMQH